MPEPSPPGGHLSRAARSSDRAEDYDVFAPDELAVVLSRYELGPIQAISAFARGSRRSPKRVVRTDQGVYLLKRRAPGRDDPYHVAFAHELQVFLADKGFPLPRLIPTRTDRRTLLRLNEAVYELFEFIRGEAFGGSVAEVTDAGKTLALFHKLVRDFEPSHRPPAGSYHDASSIRAPVDALPAALSRADPAGDDDATAATARFLLDAYRDAAARANDLGLTAWPLQVAHSDWHPGNMLFHKQHVVAVIDYDGAMLHQRALDVANGALHFSLAATGNDPSQWPDEPDPQRFEAFLHGYDGIPQSRLSRAELAAVPWLMIEALIAEAVVPIAATGSFARFRGRAFLAMIDRKVRWLQRHGPSLVRAFDDKHG